MKMQSQLKQAVKLLVEELMVSFPLDAYEAQVTLMQLLRKPETVRQIRSAVELQFIGELDE